MQDGTAAAGQERRAAAERRARHEQILLEHPAVLRQRDQLVAEVSRLRETAVAREAAAFDEGLRAGREVCAAELMPLAQHAHSG